MLKIRWTEAGILTPNKNTAPMEKSHGELLLVLGLIGVGALVRIVFLLQWSSTPLFFSLYGDELNFHNSALGLLGLGPEPGAFLYQPLVTFFLAGLYSLFGPDLVLPRILFVLFGLVNIYLLYGLGKQVGGTWVGRLSAAFAAVYGPFVFFEGQLLAPAMVVPLVTGALWSLIRAGHRKKISLLLVSGVCSGLALMGRPNLLIVLPVAFIWWSVVAGTWRMRIIGAMVAALGLVVGMSPSWIHNALKGDGLVPVSASTGHSFYLGNNPQATGLFHVPKGEKIDASSHAAYIKSWKDLASAARGRDLTLSEVSSYWLERGLQWWKEHPGDAMALLGKKLFLCINAEEMPIHHPYYAVQELAPILGLLPGFGVVFPFAVLGVLLAWKGRQGLRLLALCAGVYLVGVSVFYVADRYRILALPMIIPLAGAGVVTWSERIKHVGLRKTWWLMLVLLAVEIVVHVPVVSDMNRIKARYGLRNLMGKSAADSGDFVSAEKFFLQAVKIAGPSHGSVARENLGILAEKRGELQRALKLYGQAALMDSESRSARVHMARLYEKLGKFDDAIERWRQVAKLSSDPLIGLEQIERLQKLKQKHTDGKIIDQ